VSPLLLFSIGALGLLLAGALLVTALIAWLTDP
jgi:hypothetical protein